MFDTIDDSWSVYLWHLFQVNVHVDIRYKNLPRDSECDHRDIPIYKGNNSKGDNYPIKTNIAIMTKLLQRIVCFMEQMIHIVTRWVKPPVYAYAQYI